jgi:hypothetical protein
METQQAIQYNTDLFNETIANFEKMYELGQIDDEEFEGLRINAYQEYQERLENILDIDAEGYDELEYGADDSDYAEFSVGSQYGAALLELGEAVGFEDVESYCYGLAEATGYDPNDIYSILTGELDPSDEFSIDVANAIDPGNEELEANLFIAGVEERGEDINDYLNDEDEYEEDEDEDEEYDSEASYRVAQLESEIAEFKSATTIKDELQMIEQQAWALVQQGKVTPNVVQTMLGNFSTDGDRYAHFSSLCDQKGLNPAIELYGMNYALRVLETMPEIASFGYEVEEEISDEELEEEDAISQIAAEMIKFRNQNK